MVPLVEEGATGTRRSKGLLLSERLQRRMALEGAEVATVQEAGAAHAEAVVAVVLVM